MPICISISSEKFYNQACYVKEGGLTMERLCEKTDHGGGIQNEY